MAAIDIIRESFVVYRKGVMRFLSAVAVYLVADILIAGALLGILMLFFLLILLLGFIKSVYSLYFLAAIAAFLFLLLIFFLNSFRGGFYGACYSIYQAKHFTPVDFLDYSLRRFPSFSSLILLQLFLTLLVAVPLIALNYFVQNTYLLWASAALMLIAAFIISLPFALALPAVVVDNVGWLMALRRSARTLLSNPLQFSIMFIAIVLVQAVFLLIPLLGPFLFLLIALPVTDSAFVIFYRSLRKI